MRIKKNTDTHTLYDLRQIAADFPAQLRTAVRHYIYSE